MSRVLCRPDVVVMITMIKTLKVYALVMERRDLVKLVISARKCTMSRTLIELLNQL